jgi:hypothetical protein
VTDALRQLVAAVHASPIMLAYEFAGAGSLALRWLHAVGGSSRTVLEAVDRYASASLAEAVGGVPTKAVSGEVAACLASHARRRANALAPPGVTVVGVGCTATIATDRVKRGDHGIRVAVEGALGRHALGVTPTKGVRDRDEEERLASTLVVYAAATGCGVMHRHRVRLRDEEVLDEAFAPAPPLAAMLAGRRPHVALTPAGELCDALPWPGAGVAIVSGSFNPLHEGHLGLAAAAQAHLGRRAAFELAPRNAAKRTIEALELYRRATQFQGRAPLLLTGVALFSHKAALYPGSVFVIGVDTAARVISPRFYTAEHDLDTALDMVRTHGCRFLVAGRRAADVANPPIEAHREDGFVTLTDLDVPDRHADLFEALPERAFRADVSSSALRAAWDHELAGA